MASINAICNQHTLFEIHLNILQMYQIPILQILLRARPSWLKTGTEFGKKT